MKMYVKPSIEVIELQLKENIAAVPTTVYRGSKKGEFAATTSEAVSLQLTNKTTGLKQDTLNQYEISIA